jgi:hypothetical protein
LNLRNIPLFGIPLLSFALVSLIPNILYRCPRVLSLLASHQFFFAVWSSTHRVPLLVNLFTEYLVLHGRVGSLSFDGTRCRSAKDRVMFQYWQVLASRKLGYRGEEGTPILRLMAEREGAGDRPRQQHHISLCAQGSADALIVHQYTL